MNDSITWSAAIARARRVLAADYACDPQAFVQDGLTFSMPAVRVGRRRFPIPVRPLAIGTFGRGVVVLCGDDRQEPLRAMLKDAARDDIFAAGVVARLVDFVRQDGQIVHGPHPTFLCSSDRLMPAAPPSGVAIDILLEDSVGSIPQQANFPHAVPATERPGRPTMAARPWPPPSLSLARALSGSRRCVLIAKTSGRLP